MPAAIRDAIVDTNYQSLVGPLTWKGGPTNPVPNVLHHPAGRRPMEEGHEIQIRPEYRLQPAGSEHSRSTARSKRSTTRKLR